VNGLNYEGDILTGKELELFPLANTEACRNLELGNYPENIDVLYCPACRSERLLKINK